MSPKINQTNETNKEGMSMMGERKRQTKQAKGGPGESILADDFHSAWLKGE